MLKKLSVFAFVLVFLSMASISFAQYDDMDIEFGVKAGWFFWMDEDLTDSDLDNTWALGADLTMWMSEELGITAGGYFSMKDIDDLGLEYKQYPLYLDLLYKMPMEDESYVYLGAGASMVFVDLSAEVMSVTASVDDTSFGFNALVGFSFDKFFVEAQYTWAEVDFGLGSFGEGINVGGLMVAGGVRF